jgi:hypothetical protein
MRARWSLVTAIFFVLGPDSVLPSRRWFRLSGFAHLSCGGERRFTAFRMTHSCRFQTFRLKQANFPVQPLPDIRTGGREFLFYCERLLRYAEEKRFDSFRPNIPQRCNRNRITKKWGKEDHQDPNPPNINTKLHTIIIIVVARVVQTEEQLPIVVIIITDVSRPKICRISTENTLSMS